MPTPFLQLDIPVTLPNEQDLYTFCVSSSFSSGYKPENGIVVPVACKMPSDDWRSSTNLYGGLIFNPGDEDLSRAYEDAWFQRVNCKEGIGDIHFNPKFESQFPELVSAMNSLPFKYITAAFIMLAGMYESVPHRDPTPLQLVNEYSYFNCQYERFNIQLNCFNNPRFYLTNNNIKHYIKVTPGYPCFAFNNKDFLHGADPAISLTEQRMQILVYGIVDEIKYNDLITKSKEKFQG